jgi:hypothetical protein
MNKLKMTFGKLVLEAELLDTELLNAKTAQTIWAALPFEARANTWGEEVYFSTPVAVSEEASAKTVVQPGELAYWPPGNAIAIGFGRTPVSKGDEIRLASPCNVWGKALGDVKQLSAVKAGSAVKVEKA